MPVNTISGRSSLNAGLACWIATLVLCLAVPGEALGAFQSSSSAAERPSGPELALAAETSELEVTLRSYFERLAQFGLSGSVLVAEGTEPVFVGAYGFADREASRPFLPSTIVTIGSITKSVTAAAILKLQDMGLIDVRARISAYLDGVPSDKRAITVHHLLTHTSGLKRNGLEGGDFSLDATREAVLADALGSELLAPPGDGYRYSNLGYSLLAMIVENASGLSYEAFIRRHLLTPARMYRTGYLRPHYAHAELAVGYRDGERLDAVIRQPMLEDGPTWNLRGNGGLHSDPFDMYRWFLGLRNRDVLSERAVRAMTRAHVAQGRPGRSYGYGWEIGHTPRGTPDISHSGGNGYFGADLHWLPEEDIVFFVASNDASRLNMRRLSATVLDILFDENIELPPRIVHLPPQLLKRYEGRYRLPGGGILDVATLDGRLVLTAEHDDALQTVLGGNRIREDKAVDSLGRRSKYVVAREFEGDFRAKSDAMGGAIPLDELERYHRYDREVWETTFGPFQGVAIVAAAGERDETIVVLKLRFRDGSAAQIHTWRHGRLANISVIPDWSAFEFSRTLYPISETLFTSFSMGSSIRVEARFQPSGPDRDEPSLIFARHPDRPMAVRIHDTSDRTSR